MELNQEHLKEKALLLLRRERELFELRMKHQQVTLWLKLAQALPQVFGDFDKPINDGYAFIRKALIEALRWQRVLFLELGDQVLTAVVPAGPARPLTPECVALLQREASGVCNDPTDAAGAALAEAVGLARFIWSRIDVPGRVPVVVFGGFDRAKAKFQTPFDASDAAHLRNATQHLQGLIGNVLLVHELELERDRLQQTNQTLERRDRELHALTEELRAANDTLDQRVKARTQELGRRNHDMRLVLDNVVQGLLTVDGAGRIAQEHSAKVDEWFGAYEGSPYFIDYMAKIDPDFAERFDLGFESMKDGVLPVGLCLTQLPSRFSASERIFHCSYRPLSETAGGRGLLVMIDDVTEQVRLLQEEVEQRELLAVFQSLMKDRSGFLALFAEANRMMEELIGGALDRTTRNRHLHTLKGNTAMMGLEVVAQLCHRAEDELSMPAARGIETTIQQLGQRWAAIKHTLDVFADNRAEGVVEIPARAFEQLCEDIRRGASADHTLRRLGFFRLEPVERPLGRLAQQARALAQRMGKPEPSIVIEASDARTEPRRFDGLWATLVHVVRNAIDHGIEPPSERLARGKSEQGRLWLRASHTACELTIEIEDDGCGIDWTCVRQLAESRGLPHQSTSDLLRTLTSDGFSTKSSVTAVSGRGVGMSAVHGQVLELGGTLSVDSERWTGSRWTIVVPLAASTRTSQPIGAIELAAGSV